MLQKLTSAPRNLINFYGDVKAELRNVTWPGNKEVYGTTFVVLVTVFFFGFYLFLVDIILRRGVDMVFSFFQ